jgi:hypothetical protein
MKEKMYSSKQDNAIVMPMVYGTKKILKAIESFNESAKLLEEVDPELSKHLSAASNRLWAELDIIKKDIFSKTLAG